jgi:NAD(P)H-quinone oxidoreductase subunit 5
VHLGVFLLLRISPLLEASMTASIVVITIGALSAMHATFVGRVQTDVKSSLAYASMAQIGIIVIEIGLGFSGVAIVHICGHAILRTMQILRSPNILHDRHHIEQAMGELLPRTGAHLEKWVPQKYQVHLYGLATERGLMDTLLVDYIAGSFLKFANALDSMERKLSGRTAGLSVKGEDY